MDSEEHFKAPKKIDTIRFPKNVGCKQSCRSIVARNELTRILQRYAVVIVWRKSVWFRFFSSYQMPWMQSIITMGYPVNNSPIIPFLSWFIQHYMAKLNIQNNNEKSILSFTKDVSIFWTSFYAIQSPIKQISGNSKYWEQKKHPIWTM